MSINKEQESILEGLDQDRPDRYDVRKRWYPERLHKTDKAEGPIDCMGDESLYKHSILGSACAEPLEVGAGEISILKLKYCCGSEGVAEGISVRFYMRGQAPLGEHFQINDALHRGYAEVYGPDHCVLEPLNLGFRIKSGYLKEGDVVEIVVGKKEGFHWTKIAGRYEFKVVFNYGEGKAEKRLPEPVVIKVCPGEIHHLEATLPCTDRRMEEIHLNITARDQFDNRVELNDNISVKSENKTETVRMVKGRAECFIKTDKASVSRLEVIHEKSNIKCFTNPCIPAEEYELFIGDLHVHDFLSEAHQYTDKVYDWAIEDKNLDFASVSIQTHGWIDNEKWAIVKYMNERFLEEGSFVTFLANEWQHSAYGDKVIHYLGGDQPFICVDDPRYKSAAKLYKAVRASDAVVISHHSSYPSGSWCSSTNYSAIETDVERLTELWSMHGSSEGFDLNDRPLKNMDVKNTVMEGLRKGLRLGFVAGSDTHSGRPGGSAKEPLAYWGGLAAVWATSLTRRDVFEALRARRTYALTGARIILKMTVNDAFMGSELPASEIADIKIDVWAQSNIKKVQLIKNTLLYKEFEVHKDEYHLQLEDKTGGAAFYHCRVIQEDGHLAVCSPVWIG